jgi:NAD-dependent dihydropyrimidine dehydrogenase PreA subunit
MELTSGLAILRKDIFSRQTIPRRQSCLWLKILAVRSLDVLPANPILWLKRTGHRRSSIACSAFFKSMVCRAGIQPHGQVRQRKVRCVRSLHENVSLFQYSRGQGWIPVWERNCLLCLTCEMKCPKDAITTPISWIRPLMKYNVRHASRDPSLDHVRVTHSKGRTQRILREPSTSPGGVQDGHEQ